LIVQTSPTKTVDTAPADNALTDNPSIKANAPAQARPAIWKWLLRLALGVIMVGVLVAWQGQSVRQALASASWPLLLGAVVFYLASQGISAAKWQMLLNAAARATKNQAANSESSDAAITDHKHRSTLDASRLTASTPDTPLAWTECYRIYLIGMFWNLWMPTSIGGDAMRAYLATRRSGNLPLAASSILVERLTGFVSLMAIGAAGLLLRIKAEAQSSAAGGRQAWSTLILAVALLAGFCLTLFVARHLAYNLEAKLHNQSTPEDAAAAPTGWQTKVARLWIKLHRALDIYLLPSTRGALLAALLMSVVFQSIQIALNIWLARAVGLDLPLETFLWLMPSLAIAAMLPLGIGGLGVREAAAVALLGGALATHHIVPGTVIAWSLLWQATLWLSALPGAIAHALRRD
jgi:uncharacterized protein (TIRG00374 family)